MRLFCSLAALLGFILTCQGQNDILVSGNTGTTTWTANNTYILDGYVFVADEQVLTIEAGTIIKGASGSGVDASALIVAKGGQIFAQGTANAPIIMTYEADPLDGSVAYDTRGQWGGLIILGDASTNFGGPAQVEGIPADNDQAVYGGSNDADNSGVLSYVSLRHGGTELGAANEINGITLGGVGSGTTIDHVEVVSNLDDGIEFFGGTVSVTNALVAFCGDDSFDWDQGYRGQNNANWLAIQDAPNAVGDRGGELDGDDSDDGNVTADEMPFSTPSVNGWTVVSAGNNQGLLFRNGSGGSITNGLICGTNEGIEIEDKETPEDAFDRFIAGDLTLSNIKLVGGTDALDYDGSEVVDGDAQLDAYAAANGIEVSTMNVDYTFAFDAAGQQATDPIDLDVNQGSGHGFASGWTFCDERALFVAPATSDCDCPPLSSRPLVTISEAGEGTGTTTWTCDNTYILDGYVFVNSGQALTIEAGTVIKGAAGSGVDASALIVSKGGQIFAEGGADCPIIMTYEADPLDGSVAYDTRGQWGGLIILGDASTNFGGPAQVEGIPADNDRAVYGGSNDADNSGVLAYVSLRHGGTELGAANEINGITLGGVGSGTTIDHVEVISNLDDGIEFFGGTVSVTNALVAFCGDDSFDWDQGYRGANNANWLAIQDAPNAVGDRGGELDGDDSDDGNVTADEMPFSTPTVNGWTVVSAGNNQGLVFRNGSGGSVTNGLICGTNEGIEIEDKETPEDAFDRFIAGDLNLSNIKLVGGTDALDYDGSEVADGDAQLDAYAAANGIEVSTMNVDYTFAFDAAGQQATDPIDLDVNQGSGDAFAAGWTFCDERGLFATTTSTACDCPPLSSRPLVTISEAGEGTGTTTWTCDNTYILDGYVFVNSGQALTIEAGTVIKGAAGSGVDASALIVSKGGQIFAEGGADCPIIMTYEADPLDGSVAYDTRGQWGGLIVLGDASTNFGGPAQVEGIPADNDRAVYGGANDADNSGVLAYVSVRHGGTELGAANEINGITLGGVGSGTTIDHVEVISNLDDGIEFFGGTVSVTNAVVAFCGDDSFDWDQGYRGANNANWLVIQDQPGGVGDRGGELDGDDSDDGNVTADEMPFSTPTVNGWTVVGVGGNQGLLFRNGSGGNVSNGLLTNVSEGIEIEDKETPEDAFDRFIAGDLTLSNIKVMGTDDALDYDGSEVADGDAQLDAYAAANGVVVDNSLSIDYTFAFDAAGQQATDKLYIEGGQGSGSDWTQGWSFVDERRLFADSFDDGMPNCEVGDCYISEAHNGSGAPYVEITNTGNQCSMEGMTLSSSNDSFTFGDVVIGSGDFLTQSMALNSAGDNLSLTDGLNTLSNVLMAAYSASPADYSQNFSAGAEVNGAATMGCYATPTPGAANADCATTGCGDELASNYDPNAINIDNTLCEFNGGCSDPEAENYDDTANLDDGSCQYTIRIIVDMAQQGSTGASIVINGNNAGNMAYANFDAYSYDFNTGEGDLTVSFIAGDGTAETASPRTITIAAPLAQTTFVYCFDENTNCTGCTDPSFLEYNAYAVGDDASCSTNPVLGCTYLDAENYDATASVDDGSCTGFGSSNDCPSDLNQDGAIGAGDLLIFLGEFGSTCE